MDGTSTPSRAGLRPALHDQATNPNTSGGESCAVCVWVGGLIVRAKRGATVMSAPPRPRASVLILSRVLRPLRLRALRPLRLRPLRLLLLRRLPALLCSVAVVGSVQAAQSVNPRFDGARAFEDVRQLVAIGPRVAGSPGAQAARDYIRKQLQAVGVTVEEQPFEAVTPLGRVRMVNLRATFPAASGGARKARLVIGGHYDTKLFKEFTFVGANDAGSSTAFLIELARTLKSRSNPMPIELLFLDGEEAIGEWETGNTYGSRHYVDAARGAGSLRQIKAMILVDMVADKDLAIKRESRSTP